MRFITKTPKNFAVRPWLWRAGSISALEIASDLAMLGAKSVHLTQRRQRYVMPKMVLGVPLEYYAFNRAGALARDTQSADALWAGMQDFVLTYGGDPARYGAPSPHPDISKAGFTGSQHYLNLVAEARLSVHPWFDQVDGQTVTFKDGESVEADAILIGTGFDLDMAFLSDQIVDTLNKNNKGLELADFTFHPDLTGLAFCRDVVAAGPLPRRPRTTGALHRLCMVRNDHAPDPTPT